MNTLEGAYSLVLMPLQKLICARDPHGFRPLCFGKTPDGIYIAASEGSALKAVGADFIRDVMPGEILAKHHPVDADIVIGVPDSGLDAALGFSKQSGRLNQAK